MQCSIYILQGVPKELTNMYLYIIMLLLDHGAQAKSPVAGDPCVWKNVFGSFLTKTKQDQALPSHVNGKVLPHSTQFLLGFFSISQYFGDILS